MMGREVGVCKFVQKQGMTRKGEKGFYTLLVSSRVDKEWRYCLVQAYNSM